ncbi:hypothetical protein HBB16_00220 [Pseudonocardia sp. MCCB 268]|nr:hypothetical protein [Pseudonocardia cytotoxica]
MVPKPELALTDTRVLTARRLAGAIRGGDLHVLRLAHRNGTELTLGRRHAPCRTPRPPPPAPASRAPDPHRTHTMRCCANASTRSLRRHLDDLALNAGSIAAGCGSRAAPSSPRRPRGVATRLRRMRIERAKQLLMQDRHARSARSRQPAASTASRLLPGLPGGHRPQPRRLPERN